MNTALALALAAVWAAGVAMYYIIHRATRDTDDGALCVVPSITRRAEPQIYNTTNDPRVMAAPTAYIDVAPPAGRHRRTDGR